MTDKHNPSDVNAPIFLVGAPRSGISLLMEALGIHPDLAWISNWENKFLSPGAACSLLNRLYDLPGLRGPLYRKMIGLRGRRPNVMPYPIEPLKFWNRHIPGFTRFDENGLWMPDTPTEKDLTDEVVLNVRKRVRKLTKRQGRKRFISYYGSFPRIRMMSAIFPDALFVHVVRDGRAVCESMLRQIESGQFNTWEEREYWPKVWPAAWRKAFAEEHPTPFALTVYLWMHALSVIWEEAEGLPGDRFLEIAYEDVVEDPEAAMHRVQGFCRIPIAKEVTAFLKTVPPRNSNLKWKSSLSAEDRELFSAIVKEEKFTELLESE